jgi:ParB-like chromosome segregation protein Spo0J
VKEIQDKVENWDVDAIRPYEGNAKIHTDEQVESIAKSINKFGFDQPIVVDGAGIIIKGHGRHLAAQHLGMEKVPVIVRMDLTANEANASRLADNRVAVGDVDTNLLNKELEAIAESDDDLLQAMGFSEKELEFMTTDLGDMDESALMDMMGDETSEAVSDAISDSEGVSDKKIPTKDLFGFTHVLGSDAKVLSRWLSTLVGEYESESTVEAMVAHAKDYLESE